MTSSFRLRTATLCTAPMLFLLSGCFGIDTPGVVDTRFAATSFSHQGLSQSCSSCHEVNRPKIDLAGQPTNHGSGQDCVTCHRADSHWLDLQAFSHLPSPSSCVSCHEKNRPSTTRAPASTGGQAGHFGRQDCAACHQTQASTGNAFAFSHRKADNQVVGTCLPCHEPRRPSADHGAGQDCASCHADPARTWLQSAGSPHPANFPMPSNCNKCHETARPRSTLYPAATVSVGGHFGATDCIQCHAPRSATVAAFQFSHSANGRSVTSCIPCHESSRPAPDHNPGRDCLACHNDPQKPWKSPTASPHPGANSSLLTCNNCHEDSRPTTTQFPAPGPRVTGHFGAQDCYACHAPRTATISLFTFDHAANGSTRTTCLPCHEARRPAGVVGSFNHATAGNGDCKGCHTSTVAWTGGIYTHTPVPTTCNSCHSGDRPTLARYPDGATASGHYAAKDCTACHRPKSATITRFTFGHSDSGNANIGFCLPCHTSDGKNEHGTGTKYNYTGDGNCYTCHNVKRKSFSAR